ncbi:MAG TPA: hypothetical protein VMT54_16735 [Candidatus Cybelea sp.]|nr:hypothetical protein [Candidatus Cybelea sp.]
MQQLTRSDIRAKTTKPNAAKLRLIGLPLRGEQATRFQQALRALDAAYSIVGAALYNRIQRPAVDVHEISALGASYGWISERRSLVQSFLDAEPAVLAYAGVDFDEPEHIRSLAETAAELASEHHSLISAIALLSYIDQELGWTAVTEVAGNA